MNRGLLLVVGLAGTVGAAIPAAAAPAPLFAQTTSDTIRLEIGQEMAEVLVSRHMGYAAFNASGLPGLLREPTRNSVFFEALWQETPLRFEAGSPFFRFGQETHQLANPAYVIDGDFWLPTQLIEEWMPVMSGQVVAADPDLEVALASDSEPPSTSEPPSERVDPEIPWRVIIDPGHGGRDPGTLGTRSREKDIVLAIATRLAAELEGRPGVIPILTRDSDVYIEHDARSQFAVDESGDLFISIHANASFSSAARGFETFFLGAARSEEAREVALRENRLPSVAGAAAPVEDIQFILAGMERTENLRESGVFAEHVQQAIRGVRGRDSPDRGVKQGPWWVLLGALAQMPSVIVEVGFLSHVQEEQYLMTERGQAEIARALADAVSAYRDDVLRRFAAADASTR